VGAQRPSEGCGEVSLFHPPNKLVGLPIKATGGGIGTIKGVCFADQRCSVQYLTVEAAGWVDWSQRVVSIDVMRNLVLAAPEYHAGMDFLRAYEAQLYRHCERPDYWTLGARS
jgi:hypothetical protein